MKLFHRPKADPSGKDRTRYQIENQKRQTLTRRYLDDSEVQAFRNKGFLVTPVPVRPTVTDYESRLAKSRLAKDGTERVGGNPFSRNPKKYSGKLRTTPASIHSHVAVQQIVNGKPMTFRFPRQDVTTK